MKKIALAVLLAVILSPAAAFAQVSIRIGPPPPVYERRGPPPDRGYVWIAGYHRYEGDHYVWTPGRWDRPPRDTSVGLPTSGFAVVITMRCRKGTAVTKNSITTRKRGTRPLFLFHGSNMLSETNVPGFVLCRLLKVKLSLISRL